jgi:hypothetical protein
MSLQKYLGTSDEELCREVENKARVIGYTRLLRRTVRRPNEDGAQEKIAHYKKQLIEVIDKVDTLEF